MAKRRYETNEDLLKEIREDKKKKKYETNDELYFSVYGQDEINKIMSDYQKATAEYRNLYKDRFVS